MKKFIMVVGLFTLATSSHALDTSLPFDGNYLCGVTIVQDNDLHYSELRSIANRAANISGISIADTNQWFFASLNQMGGKVSLSVLKNYLDESVTGVSLEVATVESGQTVAFTNDSFWPGLTLVTQEIGQPVLLTLDANRDVIRTDRCTKIKEIPSQRERILSYTYHRLPTDVILDALAGGAIGE